jgi:hypothetical protein
MPVASTVVRGVKLGLHSASMSLGTRRPDSDPTGGGGAIRRGVAGEI